MTSTTRTQPESHIVTAVLAALGQRNDCRVWRQRAGEFWTRRGPEGIPVKAVPNGAADISGVLLGGRRLELETKTETGRLRPDQRRFGAMVVAWGGVYAVVRSASDAVRVVEDALAGVWTPAEELLHVP